MKSLVLFNSMTHEKEVFTPFYDEGKKDFVGVYSCGPTVYSDPHIGNLRATFTADLCRNIIQNIWGYPLVYVMNITDVGHLVGDGDSGEDKLEKGSRLEGLTAWDIAKKYENLFLDYMKQMHVERFTVMPRATEHISEQIELVQKLEKLGYTYQIEDGVYMDTSKVPDYGKLLGPNYEKHLEGLRAGARIDVKGKKNPTDFALWKFSPTHEQRQMEWESPWGKGFPGWHIECSAMAGKYLGDQFDIHTGGHDLISVHHTNEIAQSECALGVKPWVKYWVHNQFVTTNGEKASKSKGNYISLSDAFAQGYSLLDFRYLFLSYHYRNYIDFTFDALKTVKTTRINTISKAYSIFSKQCTPEQQNTLKMLFWNASSLFPAKTFLQSEYISDAGKKLLEECLDELADDMNSARLLSRLQSAMNKLECGAFETLLVVCYFDTTLLKLDIFKNITREKKAVPAEVQELAKTRWESKKWGNYELADQIREQIQEKWFLVLDSKEEYEIVEKW